MLSKDKRICPCCGKKPELIPPSTDLLPYRVKETSSGRQYYVVSSRRVLPYTVRPRSNFAYPSGYENYSGIAIKEDFCYINRKSPKSFTGIATTFNTQKKLNKDGIFLFSHEMIFFCKNCRQKLALNYNPFAVWSSSACIWFIITVLAVIFWSVGLTANIRTQYPLLFRLFAAGAAVLPLMVLYTLAGLFVTRFFLSNFVPTTETDTLIFPSPDLVTRCRINPCYFHRSNVFQTTFKSETFYVYLVKKGKDPEFRLCGTNGGRERLLALIREKRARGEAVTLPLTFEGKAAGSAEVLEIYETSEQAAERSLQ